MVYLKAAIAAVVVAASIAFVPLPPGTVVAQRNVGFTSASNPAGWSAVLSKEFVGSGDGRKFYQWHLSIYALVRGADRLRYQSPRNGAPLARVEQASGAKMWFPVQDARIVGTAQLMRPGSEQLVVQSHEQAADCGSATVTIFASKPGSSVGPVISANNFCDLEATIAADGTSVALSGPYYGHNAPLCCPTKPRASAVLRYRDGNWSETPNYFKLR
jgi:hypothetical protein